MPRAPHPRRPHAPAPIWSQIEEGVRHLVASGALRPGDAVPSVRDLARELRINPNTVAKAYQRLVDAGILETRRGEGTFVAERPPAMPAGEKARRAAGGRDALRDARRQPGRDAGGGASRRSRRRGRTASRGRREEGDERGDDRGGRRRTRPSRPTGSRSATAGRAVIEEPDPRRAARLRLRAARPQRRRQVLAPARAARPAAGRRAGASACSARTRGRAARG